MLQNSQKFSTVKRNLLAAAFLFSIAISFTLIFRTISGALLPKDVVGQIKIKSHKISLIRKGKEISLNNRGALVKYGDILQTNEKGKGQLVMKGGSNIYLGPNTKLEVTKDLDESDSKARGTLLSIWGKIRAQIKAPNRDNTRLKTPTATIGVKGTDFVVDYKDNKTQVGTINGLVNVASNKNKQKIDVPPGKMTSVSPAGDVLPLSAFAGELMKGIEFSGEQMKEEDFMGQKAKM